MRGAAQRHAACNLLGPYDLDRWLAARLINWDGEMDIYDELVRLRRLGQKCALATIVQVNGSIPSFESAKMLVREDGSIAGTVGGGCVEAEVWNAAREVMETERARNLEFNLGQSAAYDNGLICGGQLKVFVEPVIPNPQALIFGGGHVSRAISQVADIAGFTTIVIDDRESFANHERFPEAAETHAGEYEEIFPKLSVTGSSYIVIVTRGHRDDMRVLRWAVTTQPRYLAMIGSRRKTLSVIRELEKEGLPRAAFERLNAPMGLDIGAVTPEEIAVSVVAEMIAVRRNPQSGWRNLSKSVFASDESRALLK
jgi:xanthine dehydrogenase accessory factor